MRELKTSFKTLFIFTILLGGVYPLLIWAIGHIFFPKHAEGTLYYAPDKTVIGSFWIGQNFTSPKYFHPRPSYAGKGYDATQSSGSNLGPTSEKLINAVKQRAIDYRTENQISGNIPADAVTGSGSGLDPHISVANAKMQASRVASARNLSVADVLNLIDENTEGKTLWVLGEERVNVLGINLALDQFNGS